MKDSVVLISGGQDSVTTLLFAMKETSVRSLIWFDYNQKHKVERDMVDYWSKRMRIPILQGDMRLLTRFPSALTSESKNINDQHEIMGDLPASFVPGRNLFFFLWAGTICRLSGIDIIYSGVCETDYSGYPDCRMSTVKAMERTLKEGLDFDRVEIRTPLMFMDKADTFKLAYDLGYLKDIIKHTHTCYNGVRDELHDWGHGCGECPACVIRKKGYDEFLRRYSLELS
jgi:7-cyano-7-deazaguanine synthase